MKDIISSDNTISAQQAYEKLVNDSFLPKFSTFKNTFDQMRNQKFPKIDDDKLNELWSLD